MPADSPIVTAGDATVTVGDTADADAARVRALLLESARVKTATAEQLAPAIAQAAAQLSAAFQAGGHALLFGNGGSASDAQHIAAEWVGRLGPERPALPAIALTANSAEVTALGNDYGFENIFARGIEAHGRAGDVALAISTSGNSPNILCALKTARARGLKSIALLGRTGGRAAALADIQLVVPSDDTQHIQEAHIAIGHAIAALVDRALFPRQTRA